MKRVKVQSLQSPREEMKAVARRERPAPRDAGKPSFNSVEAVVRLLTRDNRRLTFGSQSANPALSPS